MRQPWRRSEPFSDRKKDGGAKTICSCPADSPGIAYYWELETRELLRRMGYGYLTLWPLGWRASDGIILEHHRPCGTKARFVVHSEAAKRLEALSRRQYRNGRKGETFQEKPIEGCRCQCKAMFQLIYPDGRVYPIRVELEDQQKTE